MPSSVSSAINNNNELYDDSLNGVYRPMRVLVDGSIIEAFYDNGDTSLGSATTNFYYPNSTANNGVAIIMEITPSISSTAAAATPITTTPLQKSVNIQPPSTSSFPSVVSGRKDSETIAICEFSDVNVWGMLPFKFDASIVHA